jgi:meiotically up-regulated gene 157 (Mug157) protein
LSGIDTYGVVNHDEFGKIYAYETDGFSQYSLLDDANVPSLLSASYLGFKTPYDPSNELIQSTRRFVLSKNNSLFFQGQFASGIGSKHTRENFTWPMAIIMEGFTVDINNNTKRDLDYVWKRLELSHVDTFYMHESFNVDNPKEFTRQWYNSLILKFSFCLFFYL